MTPVIEDKDSMRDLVAQCLQITSQSLDLGRSFTHHGGHSLSAVALSHRFREMGLVVSVGEIFRAPSIDAILGHLTRCTASDPDNAKAALTVEPLRHKKAGAQGSLGTHHQDTTRVSDSVGPQENIQKEPRHKPQDRSEGVQGRSPSSCPWAASVDRYPATDMQMALIRGTCRDQKRNIIYHRECCPVDDLRMLRLAWEIAISHEDMFQAEFYLDNGTGFWRRIYRPFTWIDVVVPSWRDIQGEILQPPPFTGIGYAFKTVSAPSCRVRPNEACIVFQVHHALIDGHSMDRLRRHVQWIVTGTTPPPSVSMLEFLVQRDRYVQQDHLQAQAREFWAVQNTLRSAAADDLGFPVHDPADEEIEKELETSFLSEVYSFRLGIPETAIASFCQLHGITAAALYHAAWALAISLLTDSDRVAFATATSGRTIPLAGALDVVGNLATTVPCAVEIDQTWTAIDFVRSIWVTLTELAMWDWAVPDECFERPLSSIIALQVGQSEPETATDAICPWVSRMNTEIPISLTVESQGLVNIQYSRRRYRRADIERTGTVFRRLFAALLKPTHTVSMCVLDTVSLDDQCALRTWGNCHSALSTCSSVHDSLVSLFRRTAKQHAGAHAAQRGGQTLTYQDLDRDSDRVCAALSRLVRPGDVVCVLADRSLTWLKAIYGVLKRGAVYCPLNPSLTTALQASYFRSSGAHVCLVTSTEQRQSAPPEYPHCLAVDEVLSNEDLYQSPTPALDARMDIEPDSGAYLCFTSGSTGEPKGVLCTHRGLVAFQRDLEVRLFAQPGTKIAQTMSVSFDGSIHEIFSALSYGATLLLALDEDPFAPLTVADAAIFTPSVAKALQPSDYQQLQYVYLVGEHIPQDVCDRWASDKTVYNMYGPTEATCGATIKRLVAGQKVTLGSPNSSTRVYVLDRHHRLTVPGWIGQVCLAGVQVSQGYLGCPDVTRAKFMPDRVCLGLGESMYCTGDLGYWTASGELALVGRKDRQIKLRGFRLDLDDVEARIARLPDVHAVAVAHRGDYLVAMVQPRSLSVAKVKATMGSILPAHAIPQICVAVDTFPLTKAGKLDYSKVSAVDSPSTSRSADPLSPRSSTSMTEVEQLVSQAWQHVLNLSDVAHLGPDSNFSLLGGHSLHQLKLASRLSHGFSCHVPLAMVLDNQKLADQARMILGIAKSCPGDKRQAHCASQSASPSSSPSLSLLSLPSPSPSPPLSSSSPSSSLFSPSLSPIERWWAERYRHAACTSSFNVSFVCELPALLNRHRLRQSWDTTLARHVLLRSRYIGHPTGDGFSRALHDDCPQAQLVTNLDVRVEVNTPFDIQQHHLIRVYITPSCMLVVASHILCDLTTMGLMLDEVASLYHGQPQPQPSLLYPVRKLDRESNVSLGEEWWIEYLKGSPESLGRAPLTSPGHRPRCTGKSIVMRLSAEMTEAMNEYIRHHQMTRHQLAVAAVALALQPTATSIDVTIGSPYINRHSESDLHTVGLFLEPLPIRVKHTAASNLESLDNYLKAVRSASRAALTHSIAWARLQRVWHEQIASPDRPLFDVMVTFHDHGAAVSLPIAGTESLYTWTDGSKFPLLVEFLVVANVNGATLMRLEYDDSILSRPEVLQVAHRATTALQFLTTGAQWSSVLEVLARLPQGACAESSASHILDDSSKFFLRRLSEL